MGIEVIAFDVNETLLDLSSLDEAFEEVLGSAELRPLWFAQMLQLSFVGGLTGTVRRLPNGAVGGVRDAGRAAGGQGRARQC